MASDVLAGPDCPGCGARQRPGAPWCTQCYLDLRAPVPPPPLPRVAERAPVPAEQDRTWPCTACGTANPLASGTCAGCGQAFLSEIREARPPLLVLPVLGDVAGLRPSHRLALAAAVIASIALLTLLLGLLTAS